MMYAHSITKARRSLPRSWIIVGSDDATQRRLGAPDRDEHDHERQRRQDAWPTMKSTP